MDIKKALDRAQWLCSQSERCSYDIRQKLKQWGVSDNDSAGIVESLITEGFIDESRFAKTFARDKARFNKWGPKKIEMSLRAKRIGDENIDLALSEIVELTNDDTLKELLAKKAKTIKPKDSYDLKSKLIRFGLSRGFEYGNVLKIVEKIV